MNAEGQHERQRIGQAKCPRGGGGGGGGGIELRTPASAAPAAGANSLHDDGTTRLVVDARKIKKERNCGEAANENGGVVGHLVAGSNEATATSGAVAVAVAAAGGNSENGHQHSRSNSVCRNISNGFHSGDILHDIIAAKLGTGSGGHGNSKNEKIRMVIEDSLSEDSKNRVQEIYLKVEQLKHEEKLLLYLRMPATLTNAGGAVDPLRQPLNPLGNRYEIHQTIMWIKTHLEEDPDVSLPKQEVYDEYNMFCMRNSMKPLSTADFGKVMKQVYPRVRPRRLGTRGNSRYCYAGMRKRVKLDTPTLPAVTDTSAPDDFEEPITEEMLGAASTLIREWAESLLKMKFPTLSALARHLVDNLRVDTRSLAAVCILCASGDAQPSSNNKVSESSPSLSVTPVAGRPGKLREAQLQLQRKLQQREHIRDQKHRHQDVTSLSTSGEKPTESRATPTMPTSSGRSSSASKACKKSKTSQSPQGAGTSATTAAAALADRTTPGPASRTPSQPAATTASPAAAARNRKVPRSSSQASAAVVSPQPNCDNNATQARVNDEIRSGGGGGTRLSRSCTPSEATTAARDGKLPAKNSRKRASLELNHQLSESSPEKQAKLMSEALEVSVKQEDPASAMTKTSSTQRSDKLTVLLPSSVKIAKTEPPEVSPARRGGSIRYKDIEAAAAPHERTANGRSSVYESVAAINHTEDKLCTIDPDALDDYLNGGNNSQEQEEELLQYFQQSSSSSSDAEANNALSSSSADADHASRSDKVSQLRLILQQNLKAGTARAANPVDSGGVAVAARRETPISEAKGPTAGKQQQQQLQQQQQQQQQQQLQQQQQQHDIVLPILLNHHASQASGASGGGGTRRRVSFETSVVEQQHQQHHESTSSACGSGAALNTVPQSPNTRRRIFNFTPISPGPHSPINGRAASASKPNSANASPFVSPRNTPVPRSRSNLQGGICRSRGNQKSLARSISCSVPYTGRNETFVVPTSNADGVRLASVSQSATVVSCPKTSAEVQVGGNLGHGAAHIVGDERKILATGGCAAAFLAGSDLNPQKQLLINYPSQENLQEIKNVYGVTSGVAGAANATAAGHQSRCSQPADQEITELLNGAVKPQSFTTEQLYYRSQSVPLHRMVNPTLMSPIGQHQQFLASYQSHSFNHSSNSSIAPTPVPSEFNDFGSIAANDPYLLDDVDAGFIADDQQFLMEEDKESITKLLNILSAEGRQSLAILPDRGAADENLIESGDLSIAMLDPLPTTDLSIPPETIMDPAAVLDPSVGGNLRKIIESRSYPNTPLPAVSNAFVASSSFNDDNSDGSRSFPSTPLHTIQPDVYRESNEPMLSSPTLNSLNLRTDNGEAVVADNVCRNVNDLLETNFLADHDGDADDLGTLGNFDGLQDVDSLTPLFNDVADNNR